MDFRDTIFNCEKYQKSTFFLWLLMRVCSYGFLYSHCLGRSPSKHTNVTKANTERHPLLSLDVTKRSNAPFRCRVINSGCRKMVFLGRTCASPRSKSSTHRRAAKTTATRGVGAGFIRNQYRHRALHYALRAMCATWCRRRCLCVQ